METSFTYCAYIKNEKRHFRRLPRVPIKIKGEG